MLSDMHHFLGPISRRYEESGSALSVLNDRQILDGIASGD